jgi:hypothetical protein
MKRRLRTGIHVIVIKVGHVRYRYCIEIVNRLEKQYSSINKYWYLLVVPVPIFMRLQVKN